MIILVRKTNNDQNLRDRLIVVIAGVVNFRRWILIRIDAEHQEGNRIKGKYKK